MKILYCVPGLYNSGGMERVLTQKANWLALHGFEVHIVTTVQQGRMPFYTLHPGVALHDLEIPYEEIARLPLLRRVTARLRASRLHRRRLQELLARLRPDVTLSMYTHEMPFLHKLRHTGKRVLELHFPKNFRALDAAGLGHGRLHRIINSVLDWREHRLIRHYDRFVVLSQADAKAWGNMPGLTVIPNPVAFAPQLPEERPCSRRAMAVGRLCPQKGFDMLVSVWSMIPPHVRQGWTLDIFGEGPDRDLLESEVRRLGLGDEIRFCGRRSDIISEYRSHDLFCFPSRYEGFPLALMEAMALGLPCVAFDCPCGPAELIPDGGVGALVPPGDLAAFAKALADYMTDSEKTSATARAAVERMQCHFSEDTIMPLWRSLFSTLASKNMTGK